MGKTGVINRDFIGEENNVYHDVIQLFKIYRAVSIFDILNIVLYPEFLRERHIFDKDPV